MSEMPGSWITAAVESLSVTKSEHEDEPVGESLSVANSEREHEPIAESISIANSKESTAEFQSASHAGFPVAEIQHQLPMTLSTPSSNLLRTWVLRLLLQPTMAPTQVQIKMAVAAMDEALRGFENTLPQLKTISDARKILSVENTAHEGLKEVITASSDTLKEQYEGSIKAHGMSQTNRDRIFELHRSFEQNLFQAKRIFRQSGQRNTNRI
ncbi:MAG: hypothetical protein Q9207_002143 [Kuettlingeria erythrocarpa]